MEIIRKRAMFVQLSSGCKSDTQQLKGVIETLAGVLNNMFNTVLTTEPKNRHQCS